MAHPNEPDATITMRPGLLYRRDERGAPFIVDRKEHQMIRSTRMILGVLLAALLLLAACGQGGATGGGAPAAPTQAPPAAATAPAATEAATAASEATSAPEGGGLLDDVKKRGKLLISTDANYKPQSFKNSDGSWDGFDIDVGKEIAKRLGVEAEFLDINFDIITAGGWNDRWDMNVGSMTVTPKRKEALYFTTPYYYTPASFVVHKDSKAASIDDLKGKKVGVGSGTTYLDYLQNKLSLEGEQILKPVPEGIEAKIYDTDQLALEDLSLGDGARLDGVLTAL